MPTEVVADDTALRSGRRERALAQMEAHGIDALLLGREANARYIAGAPRLWTAGTRPFGPGCVVVRATGATHVVSTWDEGMPDDIPHEHLFGITWNPGNLLAWLQGIDGLSTARRIGTDSLTPRFARLLPKTFPHAEFVDAEPALQAARRVKTPEEVEAIRASIAVARVALDAAKETLRPGVTERELVGAFMDAMASQGVTTPATQRVVRVTPRRAKPGPVQGGDLVAFDAGVVSGGYIGELGRTFAVDGAALDPPARDLFGRADRLMAQLVAACQPGASCRDLLAAYGAAGEVLPATPVAIGLGLGFDVPVVTRAIPLTAAEQRLEPGMVLAVTATVGDGSRAVVRKDAVVITSSGQEVLTPS